MCKKENTSEQIVVMLGVGGRLVWFCVYLWGFCLVVVCFVLAGWFGVLVAWFVCGFWLACLFLCVRVKVATVKRDLPQNSDLHFPP